MNWLLENKTIIITWASWDIWLETAKLALNQWAKVIMIAYKNIKKLENEILLYDKNKVLIYSCDATNENEISAIFSDLSSKWIKIDWLFNNVWDLIERKSFNESNWDLYKNTIDINFKSAYLFTKYTINIINNNSSVVMMSSMTARWWKWNNSSHYWVAKSMMIWLTKSLANELAKKYNIRVNSVAPWYIKWAFHNKYTKKEVELEHAMANPLNRVWEPKDVSWVVVFLLSDLSSYVNWVTIDINWWSFIC